MNIATISRSGASARSACGQCLRQQQSRLAASLHPRHLSRQLSRHTRFLSTRSHLRSEATAAARTGTKNPLLKSSRTSGPRDEQVAHYRRRMALSAAGIAICAVSMFATVQLNVFGLPEKGEQAAKKEAGDLSNSSGNGSIKLEGPGEFPSGPSVIRIQGQDGVEQVETGNSSVPLFPTTIKLPKSTDTSTLQPGQELPIAPESEEEYQLLGLGIRTVSFLSIQVYVVGLYIAKSDIGTLQQRLVQIGVQPPSDHLAQSSSNSLAATSLVSTEREMLKKLLLDPEKSEAVWASILKEGNVRTAIRIVPTRNTDFMHLRDAWVRHMTNRAQKAAAQAKELAAAGGPRRPGEFEDESFGQSVNEFKTLMGGGSRKNIPKGQVLLLLRDQRGALDALFQPDPQQPIRWLGRVADERISRCVWLNYLAGKAVASEAARASIVDGVMGIVERPVGTVIQKVI